MSSSEILNALAAPHAQLYMTNAEFHYQVDILARMLPVMVDGFAEAAAQGDVKRTAMIRATYLRPL